MLFLPPDNAVADNVGNASLQSLLTMNENLMSSAELFKALGHPARLQLLDALRDGERCVCDITQTLALRQSCVSQHLAVLREVGVLEMRREGWRVFYRISQPDLIALLNLANQVQWRRVNEYPDCFESA